jgi:hypothetical protein
VSTDFACQIGGGSIAVLLGLRSGTVGGTPSVPLAPAGPPKDAATARRAQPVEWRVSARFGWLLWPQPVTGAGNPESGYRGAIGAVPRPISQP